MKILFCSDTHLGFDFPVRPRIVRRRRGEDFFRNFQTILDHAIEYGVDAVIHGGDLFFRSKVPLLIVNKAYEMLFEFAEQGIPIFIVPGNHERSRLPVSILTRHPLINIFEKPKTFRLEIDGISLGISGFPYTRNIREFFLRIVDRTGWNSHYSDIKLLCFHQAVEGVKIKNYTFRYGGEVIKSEDLSDQFHCLLSGHIHRKQVMKFNKGEKEIPVIYSGSTEKTSFQEMDEDKGFYTLEFRQFCDGWKLSGTEFHKLETRPMVKLKIPDNIRDVNSLKSFLLAQRGNLDKNAILKLECSNIGILEFFDKNFIRSIFPDTMNFHFRYPK
ncbi:MAG: DNA repair exonuclease [Candidatus Cloacimonetes bacterium]|nr:DNA repair exonuclease [Candidatus Cloacimonadota bacterium]